MRGGPRISRVLAPVALLLATYSTFGPIAQDDSSLYIADRGSVVRVAKNDPSQRTALTVPSSRRIAAIDVDGDRVIYATAPVPQCTAVPTFPPATIYVHYVCSLTDASSDHELRSVSMFGSDERFLVHAPNGITEIEHDDQWIYWLEPGNGVAIASARLLRKSKETGGLDPLYSGLMVSATNQHPFVLAGDSIYVISGTRLLRVAKSGGGVMKDLAPANADSALAEIDGFVYFVNIGRAYVLDTRSESITEQRFPVTQSGGATYPISILGAAPGLVLASEGAGWTHTLFRGWILSDLCTNSAQLLGSKGGDASIGYFIPPLAEPPIAVDSNGVYISDRRALTFANPPAGCARRRVAPR